ncbi:transforming growth factor-beta-induced protein ig-h3-like [Actinia tenebrosa]|uniref:Transforming growth factor-beta-induced protein ig-h3-like n=1 Tax=Actinia tenebrosa TaxID=6105 RepID=A0A6P8HRV3_ACTTE|nr:transforming growth factor-beta-induced protein ig-h3-like [Actinia tenebrosa]
MAHCSLVRGLAVLIILFLCIGGGLGTWWNPFGWRRVWKDWVYEQHRLSHRLDEVSKKVQQPPLQKDGINVCGVKVPITVSRECRTMFGRRRLKCRFRRYYITKYECCPAFARVEGQPGCPKELYVSKLNIIDIAKKLGLNQFVKLVTESGVGSELILDTRYTAFIPSNEAFEAIPKETLDELQGESTRLGDALLFHVLPGKLVTDQLKNNELLKTMDAPHKMRVNRCNDRKIFVVQGAKIIDANQGASNGIVHVIDKFIQPTQGTLRDYLKGKPEFSILSRLLRSHDLEDLTNVTLFAPTDKAFQALPADRLNRLLSKKDCVQKLLKYHVLDEPIYSQLLVSSRQKSMNGLFLDVEHKGNETLKVNDANIITADVTTDDAIVQVIDKLLMSIAAMELVEAVKALNLTKFSSLLERSSLMEELRNGEKNYTVFAPTDEAFEALPSDVKTEITANPQALDKALMYHMIDRKVWTYEFGRDNCVMTRSGMRVRLNTFQFGKVNAANDACIEKANLETCNGVIHVIGKVLVPAKNTIYDVINSKPQFSILARIIQRSTSIMPILAKINGSVTLFAPTDRAFERLRERSPSILKLLQEDSKEATHFLKAHLLDRTIYSCGLQCKYSYWSQFRSSFVVFSMSRDVLRLKLPWRRGASVNNIMLNPVDVAASNGVVHGIEKVMNWSPLGLRTRKYYNPVIFDWWIRP